MSKFKIGDKVKVVDCEELRKWTRGENAIGHVSTIEGFSSDGYILLNDINKYGINYTEEMLMLVEEAQFKIGDIVKFVFEYEAFEDEAIEGEAIFMGQSDTINNCWALNSLDGITGSAQNNWWNFSKVGKLEKVNKHLQISTPTQKEYNKVLKVLLDGGRERYMREDYWDYYKENTIISVNFRGDGTLTYGGSKAESDLETIKVTAKQFLGEEPKKEEKVEEAIGSPSLTELKKEDKIKQNKTMNNIIKFAKDLTLSKDEKTLRNVGLKDEDGDWMNDAFIIVRDLEAKALGFKNYDKMDEMYVDARLSALEYHALFTKYEEKILAIAKKYEKEMSKK